MSIPGSSGAGRSKDGGTRPFSLASSQSVRSNGHELKYRKCHFNVFTKESSTTAMGYPERLWISILGDIKKVTEHVLEQLAPANCFEEPSEVPHHLTDSVVL